MPRYSHPFTRAATAVLRLARGDAGAGVLLIVAALGALILANSPLALGYRAFFHDPLPWTPLAKLATLDLWINDALMAVFFFVVGLEIKREVLDGEHVVEWDEVDDSVAFEHTMKKAKKTHDRKKKLMKKFADDASGMTGVSDGARWGMVAC